MSTENDMDNQPETWGDVTIFWVWFTYLVGLGFTILTCVDVGLRRCFGFSEATSAILLLPVGAVIYVICAYLSSWTATLVMNGVRWVWGEPL